MLYVRSQVLCFWEDSTMQLPEGTSLTRTFSFALTWQHKAFAINWSSRNTSSNETQQFASTCQLLSCSDPPTGKVIPQTGLKEASSSSTFSLGLGGLAKVGMVISSSEAEQMSGERSRGLPQANPYLAHMQWDAGSSRWAYGLFLDCPLHHGSAGQVASLTLLVLYGEKLNKMLPLNETTPLGEPLRVTI